MALFVFLKASALTQRYKVLPSLGALRVIVTQTLGGFLFVKGLAKIGMLSSVPVKHVLVLAENSVVLHGRMRLHRMLFGYVAKSYFCVAHTV